MQAVLLINIDFFIDVFQYIDNSGRQLRQGWYDGMKAAVREIAT
jgi:hypothetical protein